MGEVQPNVARRFNAGGYSAELPGINIIDALFRASVLSGLLVPPLLLVVLLVANNRAVISHRVNGPALNVLGGLTLVLMSLAAVSLIVSSLNH